MPKIFEFLFLVQGLQPYIYILHVWNRCFSLQSPVKVVVFETVCIRLSKMSGASGVKLGREAEIALVWWWPVPKNLAWKWLLIDLSNLGASLIRTRIDIATCRKK